MPLRPHAAALAITVLVALAPLALAGVAPLDVVASGSLNVHGTGTLQGSEGLLAFQKLGDAPHPEVAWSHAEGVLVEVGSDGSAETVETFSLGPGGLQVGSCATACGFALEALTPDSVIGARGHLNGVVPPTLQRGANVIGGPLVPAAVAQIRGMSFAINGGSLHDLRLSGTTFAEGNLTLTLWNATVHAQTPDGEHAIDARPRAVTDADGAEPQRATRFLRLDLQGGRLANATGTPASLLLPTPQLHLTGTLAASLAHGTLPDGTRVLDAEERSVQLKGSGVYHLDPGADDGSLHITGTHEGDAYILSHSRAAPSPDGVFGGALRAIAFTGGAVAAAGLLLWAASAPLYFRIDRSEVLANENRRRIYEVIKENPGLTRREIADAVDVLPSVAGYHLQKLREYQFVASRRIGRNRTYFVPETVADAEDFQASHILRNPTRRNLARALVEHDEPPSQRDLAEQTGLSQRLVSYHLNKLLDVGLVNAQQGPPARYEPTDRLHDVLTGE